MAEPPLDRIHIHDLQLRCIIGVYPEERRDKQDVNIDITLHADLRKACSSDDLGDTIDYKSLKKRIVAMVEGSSFQLIEALAERIASLCLDEPRVRSARVYLAKPGALRFARTVAVEIERTRDRADS